MIIPACKIPKTRYKSRLSFLTVCYYHITYEFQSESTLYSLPECQRTPCSKQVSYLSSKWINQYIIAKSRQRYDEALNHFLLYISKHALKDMRIITELSITWTAVLKFHQGANRSCYYYRRYITRSANTFQPLVTDFCHLVD